MPQSALRRMRIRPSAWNRFRIETRRHHEGTVPFPARDLDGGHCAGRPRRVVRCPHAPGAGPRVDWSAGTPEACCGLAAARYMQEAFPLL
ncbi:hypothetical protein GCM10022377_04120 [Zhihengliuella alba]|uniref:Uncharacterized protein n=1 Tax=Zhihengliuella alba TaxID=547018 RepID=A0ABP7CU60_9MICC